MSEERQRLEQFELARFVDAQEESFSMALKELRRGQKESHWMWFIFPQLAGLGTSPMAVRYAIQGFEEAGAYLKHPVLGPRLIECCRALLSVEGKSASDIMGYPDDLKLKSSMTLFAGVAEAAPEFQAVLLKYFAGAQDERTLGLLKQ